jgi:ATP-binding cassette subfamily B protein
LLQKEGQIASVVEENILSQTVVKIFGLENQMIKDFSTDLNDLKQVYVRATFLSYLVQKVPMIGLVLAQLIVLSIGAVMTYQNIISLGTLASFQVLMLGLNLNIFGLTSSLPAFIDAVAGLQRICHILEDFSASCEQT